MHVRLVQLYHDYGGDDIIRICFWVFPLRRHHFVVNLCIIESEFGHGYVDWFVGGKDNCMVSVCRKSDYRNYKIGK